jgi:RNA polymerase sigma-70 factor (ECF subfamily)
MIPSTHLSLLNALKVAGRQDAAWERFHNLYRETIRHWCLRRGLQPADAADVTQAVLLRLFRSLPHHDHDPSRRFRSWLKAVVNNAIRDVYRDGQRHPGDRAAGGSDFHERLAGLAAPDALDDLTGTLTRVVDPYLGAAIERVKERVEPRTWQACWLQVVDGLPAAEAAERVGIGVASAYQARARVRRMLKVEYLKQSEAPGGDGTTQE